MAKTEESIIGDLEKLALITDGMQNIFPDGVGAIVFELKPHDFYRVKNYFKQLAANNDRFKIDISGIEVIFILEGSIANDVIEYNPIEEKPTPKKKKFWSIFLNSFSRKNKS